MTTCSTCARRIEEGDELCANCARAEARGNKRIDRNASLRDILDTLVDDGFTLTSCADAKSIARAIQHAARVDALVWTREHVITTSTPRVVTRRDRVVELA